MRVLILQANPHTDAVLQLDQEVKEIKRSLTSTLGWGVEILQEGAVQASELQGLLLRHKPEIVHFSGHGTTNGNLVFQGADGNEESVSIKVLSTIFSELRQNICCVVLNCCYS